MIFLARCQESLSGRTKARIWAWWGLLGGGLARRVPGGNSGNPPLTQKPALMHSWSFSFNISPSNEHDGARGPGVSGSFFSENEL